MPYVFGPGRQSVVLERPEEEPPGIIDHFYVGVEDFDSERVAAAIQDAGLDQPDQADITEPPTAAR